MHTAGKKFIRSCVNCFMSEINQKAGSVVVERVLLECIICLMAVDCHNHEIGICFTISNASKDFFEIIRIHFVIDITRFRSNLVRHTQTGLGDPAVHSPVQGVLVPIFLCAAHRPNHEYFELNNTALDLGLIMIGL